MIEPFKRGQENAVHLLVKTVFDEFVAPEYSKEGNEFFYHWISPEAISQRQRGEVSMFVASVVDRIVGVIEMRDNNHISLLFVDKEYHRKGIATALFANAVDTCLARDNRLNTMYVHASPYSIPIYQHLGFDAVDKVQEQHGIKYLPMKCLVTVK